MKAFFICRARVRWLPSPMRLAHLAAWALLLAFTGSLLAAEVRTLTGGPAQFYPQSAAGYVDGDTATIAQFNTPSGIAVDNAGNTLFVADRENNAIRQIDLSTGQTFTFATSQISRPVGVAVDGAGKIYVLNRGSGNNGTVLTFESPAAGGERIATNATGLVNAGGIALDSFTNIYVTVQDTVIRITPEGVTSTFVTISDAGASLQGITVKRDGRIAVCDAGRHGIYLIDPNTGVVTTNAGFHGVGDFTTQNNVASSSSARFNQPYGVTEAGDGTLVVTDNGNHRVKAVLASGVVTNLYGVSSGYWVQGSASDGIFPGWWDGNVAVPDTFGTVESRSPVGVVFAPNGTVYTTETHYHLVRSVTGTGLPLPPPPPTPVPAPRLGWVDFTIPPSIVVSILRTGPSPNFNTFTFNNDRIIAIDGTEGTETHFTVGPTVAGQQIPDPTPTSGSSPPEYHDGMFPDDVPESIIELQPDVTVKAISFQAGRPSSAVIQARFIFKVASPVIFGDNAALFSVDCQTTNATMWYTIDGTDPTNAPPSEGPIRGPANISLNITSNTTFKIRAFRDNFQPSEIATRVFSPTDFNANKISFGFESGEASSDFVASAGQFFYAPVTLSIVPGTAIYSLQFNITVTNAGPNPGPAVTPGALGFESFLEKPIPGIPGAFEIIPPLSFSGYQEDPPPLDKIVIYGGLPFVDMAFVNTNNNLNLLGIGWLERFGQTNLYNTRAQDLITFSQPHDTLFEKGNGKVVLGGYAFQLPISAQDGHTYQIQLGLPSATSDGVGTPGSSVYIATPTNGSLGAGVINAIKHVTVGQRKYLAGDSAPFRWFNAGDYGNANLDNADVMQVFQSAIYLVNEPPFGSDFFDAMDACGGTYVVNPGGYLEPSGFYVTNDLLYINGLFDGNDTNINAVAFGDGRLDVCDVYVTFRRSLDPTLLQFRRFWTNGVRGAEIVGPAAATPVILPPIASAASVNFSSGDYLASAGQTLQIPVKAKITGTYPIRTLMLSLSVKSLDGSPALTVPVQFNANPALGVPSITSSLGNGNYAATWLDNDIAGLTGNATLGTLTVQIPAGAGASSAYAIHFEHASASPNGLASFEKQTQTGLITLSDRSASSWNDGIPDAWRLRYFGSIHNVLSAATSDADGDGANNRTEYMAGTDPNDRASVLRVSAGSASGNQQPFTVRWPSVEGKRYVIERSATLFEGSWTPLSTVDGTGSEMQYQDPVAGGSINFYRVRVTE